MRTATPAQAELIRKLIRSHVITDSERAAVVRRLEHGFPGKPGDCIDWLQTEIKGRKDAEKTAAATRQTELVP